MDSNTSSSDKAAWNRARKMMAELVDQFGKGIVATPIGDSGYHLQPEDCTGRCPTAQLTVENDNLTLTWTLGNDTWHGSVDPEGLWVNHSRDQRVDWGGMHRYVVEHLAREVF